MAKYLKKYSIFVLVICLIAISLPSTSTADNFFVKGKDSSDKAATIEDSPDSHSPSLRNLNSFYSQPDSTEPALFEEEEERNLVKEIIVWTIGAAFVGYFIAKVVLENDSDSATEDSNQKEIPDGGVNLRSPLFTF